MSYSFYATKNLACGEGGALVTDDDEIAAKAQVLSCHGMSAGAWNRYGKEGSWRYDIEEPGYKYNMFDIQAALALTQLGRMPDMQRRRFEAVDVYERAFADVPELRLQKTPDYCHHSRHLYVLSISEHLPQLHMHLLSHKKHVRVYELQSRCESDRFQQQKNH